MSDEKFSNFITEIIDADLAEGKVQQIHTRFPPEPNGYLHIGSAKAIYINYMVAKTYGGKFNLGLTIPTPRGRATSMYRASCATWNGSARTRTAASSTAAITLTNATNAPRN